MIHSPQSIASPAIPLSSLTPAQLRLIFLHDPAYWVRVRLGESMWSKQIEMINSVRDNRRTAFYSCHRVGKSWLLARLALWWIDTHPLGEALVVTSSKSGTQVKATLWREMSRAHQKGGFLGRMNQSEWYHPFPGGREELIAFGRKPSKDNPSAFHGTYSRYVLFLLDEAGEVEPALWDAADTLVSNEDSRIVAAGNPDDPLAEFARVCMPGSGWGTIQIGAQDTPNFTGEDVPEDVRNKLIGPSWAAEKLKSWGADNPLYISKILGRFPENNTDGLITVHNVKQAQLRELSPAEAPNELGVDVGGGGDSSTIAHRRGSHVRIIFESHDPNTMNTLEQVFKALRETHASIAKVDYIGIGKGMVDRAEQLVGDYEVRTRRTDLWQLAKRIVGVRAGDPAHESESYINLRAESYWSIRERSEDGRLDLDPNDDQLAAELCNLKYKRTGARIQIESKQDMKARGIGSPNRADAVMLAFSDPKTPVNAGRLTWGAPRH